MKRKLMNRAAVKHIVRSSALVFLGTLVVSGIAMPDTAFAALTNESPVRNEVSSGGQNGAVSHLLKYESVANVKTFKMGIYYPRSFGANANNEELRIRYGHTGGKKCIIANRVKTHGGNVVVRLDGDNSTKTYEIPMSRVCNNLESNNKRDNGINTPNQNSFFADYALPNRMSFDAATGMYKVIATIYYDAGVLQTAGSRENSVNFVTSISQSNAKLAPLATRNEVGNQHGLRSTFTEEDVRVGLKTSTQFGVACNETDTEFQVQLYDADAHQFGATWIWVTESGNGGRGVLERNDYAVPDAIANDHISWDNEKKAWKVITSGSGQTAKAKVLGIKKNVTYRFHVQNTGEDGALRPNNNVLSIGIPYDSIYTDVDCDFGFNPGISVNPKVYSYYPNLTVRGVINKNGGGVVPPPGHEWEMYAVRYSGAPSTRDISGNYENDVACNAVKSPGQPVIPTANRKGGCQRIHQASTTDNDDKTVQYINNTEADSAGDRVCFFTRIKDPTEVAMDDDQWRYTDMACAVAGISPKLQVLGHDAKVGGLINTSKTLAKDPVPGALGLMHGSWGEYGLFSDNLNVGMASGSGLHAGGENDQSMWKSLTFANVGGEFGQFNGLNELRFDPGTTNIEVLPEVNNQCRLDARNYAPNTRLVIRCNGVLIVNGNQTYDDGPYTSISAIPNVKISADDIVVTNNTNPAQPDTRAVTTRIDPWVIARRTNGFGRISTCNQVYNSENSNYFVILGNAGVVDNPIRSGVCNQQLRFNGPVIADQLYAYRTFEGNVGDPAEIFNLRADNFLSAYAGSGGDQPVARTELITELPPRF